MKQIVPFVPAEEGLPPKLGNWRNQLFWKLQWAFWANVALLTILVANILHTSSQETVLFGGLRSVFGFIATCGLRYLYRPIRKSKRNFWLMAIAVFFLCGGLGLADAAIVTLAAVAMGGDLAAAEMRLFLAGGIFMRWMLYWLWSVAYFGMNYWLDTKDAQLRLSQAEAAAQSAELQVLRAQTNPHFLFNALNSIMAEADNPEVVQNLTQALSEYLRFSLQQRGDMQRLGIELDALENYLSVEKARFEENLEYTIRADALARCTLAPTALVQPLLDNAIKYGQHSLIRPLRLTISASVMDGLLTISVVNSGGWIVPGTVASTGTGLANLQRRLQILYESKASLSVEANDERVCVTVQLPVSDKEGALHG